MYTEIIAQILTESNIPCSHDKAMDIVFVFYKGLLGDIFSMYDYMEGGVVSNYSVYTYSVPSEKYGEVSGCLSCLNKADPSVNFYIDRDTDSIAFGSLYNVQASAGCNREGLSAFCQKIHDTCISYQPVLYRILRDCGIKVITHR